VKVLADLLANKMNGTVVLVHDARVKYWKKTLGYPLIRTIRELKGLEYKSVIILDFFGDMKFKSARVSKRRGVDCWSEEKSMVCRINIPRLNVT